MGDAQSKPKASDLTPKYFISIGKCHADSCTDLGDDQLYIQCQQWESGQKFLNISAKITLSLPVYSPNILVPQEAYKFVDGIDEVIRKLPMKEPPPLPEDDAYESPQILATQSVEGAEHYDDQHYKFKLSAWRHNRAELHFEIQSVPTSEEHKEVRLYFPFWALPWLRKQMVKMLAEHDGSEQIDEMPTIPEWVTRDAPPVIEQQEPQPNVEKEHVNEKKADDAEEDDPYCSQNVGDPRASK